MGGQNEASNLRDECLTRHLMDQKRHRGIENPSQQKLKNTNFSKMMVSPGKRVLKRSDLQKSPSHKRITNLMLQDEELPTYVTMESLSPHQSHMRRVSSLNHDEEDYEEEEHEVDSVRDENIGSTSHGMSNTRKESRALNETKKRRSNKENSTYDPSCRSMVRAINTQLANQHKNRQYRLHLHFKKFSTKEEAINHPPNGVINADWVKLCQKFASEEFQ
ncbi:unnamed protein product, partial [Lactuca virosa]